MKLATDDPHRVVANHKTLGRYRFHPVGDPSPEEVLFTENDTNIQRLDNSYTGPQGYSKDAFDRYLVQG